MLKRNKTAYNFSVSIGYPFCYIKLFNNYLLSTTDQLRRSVLNDCVKFNIFGSVHAMKTEIPPFDSEIKDSTNSSLYL